jgi:hypothetical protein
VDDRDVAFPAGVEVDVIHAGGTRRHQPQRRHVPQQLACHRRVDEHTQHLDECRSAAVGVDLGIWQETRPPRTRAQSFERYLVFGCDVDEEHSQARGRPCRSRRFGRHGPAKHGAHAMAPVTR